MKMRMKMKPTVTIFVCVLAAGLASAQKPRVIQNTRNTTNAATTKATAASKAAPGTHQAVPAASSTTPAPARISSQVAVPASAKNRGHEREHRRERRVGAVLAVQNEQPAPTAAPEETAPAAAGAAETNVAEGGNAASEQPVVPNSKYDANGRRDPFLSPVVSHEEGSGCSTGKKCLEIGVLNLRGVVRTESGFIAVVSNSMNKAYFLRENDPVFNGYVMKITDDSIVFQETLQDRLGKSFTREVVKKITTPAV